MLPSSTDLNYFIDVAQSGNITHSATKLGVTQPSLSLAMQRLEQSMDVQIFIRSRKGVTLTKAGELLLINAQNLIAQWEDIKQQSVERMTQVKGRLKIGCHSAVAQYTLPHFMPDLLRLNPGLEFTLEHDLSRNITQKVQSLEMDLGIVVNPVLHGELVVKLIAKDSVTLWKAKGLKNPDVLICEPSLLQTQSVLRKLKAKGLKFKRSIESSSLEVITQLTASGAGVGLLPGRVAATSSTPLSRLANAPTFEDEIYLIYRVENRKVRAIQELSAAIQKALQGQ